MSQLKLTKSFFGMDNFSYFFDKNIAKIAKKLQKHLQIGGYVLQYVFFWYNVAQKSDLLFVANIFELKGCLLYEQRIFS